MNEQPNIPDFVTWCSETEKELPVPATTDEARKRTGAKEGLYPPQYFAGQYTDLWKVPAAADAVYYQAVAQGKKLTQ